MPAILSVVALKGGVGKSTVSLNVAAALHRDGHRALLVDADSQATLRAWAARAAELTHDGPPVVALDGRTLRRDLARVGAGFDVVVIDAPPRLGAEARAAMLAADLVVMPTTPGAADLWALRTTLDVLEEARTDRPELRGVVVLNRASRTTLTASARDALGGMGVPIAAATLGDRVAFGEATLAGQGVVDYAPASVAATEVVALVRELLGLIGGNDDGHKQGRKASRRIQAPAKPARANARRG